MNNLYVSSIYLPDVKDIYTLQTSYLIGWGNIIPYYDKIVKVLNYNNSTVYVTINKGISGDINSQITVSNNTVSKNSVINLTSNFDINSHIQSVSQGIASLSIAFDPQNPVINQISTKNNSINSCLMDKNGYPRYLIYNVNGEVELVAPLRATINNNTIKITISTVLPYNSDVTYCFIDSKSNVYVNSIEPEFISKLSYGPGIYLDFTNNLYDPFGNVWRCNSITGNTTHIVSTSFVTSPKIPRLAFFLQRPDYTCVRQHISFCYNLPWSLDLAFTPFVSSNSTFDVFRIANEVVDMGPILIQIKNGNVYFGSSYTANSWDIYINLGPYLVNTLVSIRIDFDTQNFVCDNTGQPTNIPYGGSSNAYYYDIHECTLGLYPNQSYPSSCISISQVILTPYIRTSDIFLNPTIGEPFASCVLLSSDLGDLYDIRWIYNTTSLTLRFSPNGVYIAPGIIVYTTNFPVASKYSRWTLEFDFYMSSYGTLVNYGNYYKGLQISADQNGINLYSGNTSYGYPFNLAKNIKYNLIVQYTMILTVYINGNIVGYYDTIGSFSTDPVFIIGSLTGSFTGYIKNLRFTPYLVYTGKSLTLPTNYTTNCCKDIYNYTSNTWTRIGAPSTGDILYIGSYSTSNINMWYDTLPDNITKRYYFPSKSYSLYNDIILYDKYGTLIFNNPGSVASKVRYPPIKFISCGTYSLIVDINNFVYMVGDFSGVTSSSITYIGTNVTYVEVSPMCYDFTRIDDRSGFIIDNGDLYAIGLNNNGQLGTGNNNPCTSFIKIDRVSLTDNVWKEVYTTGLETVAIVGNGRFLFSSGIRLFGNSPSARTNTFNQLYYSNNTPVSNVSKVIFRLVFDNANNYTYLIILCGDRVYYAGYRSGDTNAVSIGYVGSSNRDISKGLIDLNISNIVDIVDSGANDSKVYSTFAIDRWGSVYLINGYYDTNFSLYPRKIYVNSFEPLIVKRLFGCKANSNWVMASTHSGQTYVMLRLEQSDIPDRANQTDPLTSFTKFPLKNVIDAMASSCANIEYYYLLTADNEIYYCGNYTVRGSATTTLIKYIDI